MKKIFTLLFATAMLSTAFAQYGQKGQGNRGGDKHNDVYNSSNNGYGNDHHNNDYNGGFYFSPFERDRQIEQIRHQYDHRIREIQRRGFMSWYQKRHFINDLENRRDDEIHAIEHKFNDRRNQYGDFRRDKKRYKGNRW